MVQSNYNILHVACWFLLVFAIAICKSRGILDIEPIADDIVFYGINSYRSVILGVYILLVGTYCFLFVRENSGYTENKPRDDGQSAAFDSALDENVVEVSTPRYDSPSQMKTNVRQRFRNGMSTMSEEPTEKLDELKSEYSTMVLTDCQSNLLISLENIHFHLWRILFLITVLHGLSLAFSYSQNYTFIKILDSTSQSILLSLLCMIMFYEKGYLFPKQLLTEFLSVEESLPSHVSLLSAPELRRSPSVASIGLTPRAIGFPDTSSSIDLHPRGESHMPLRSNPVYQRIHSPPENGQHNTCYRSTESQDPVLDDPHVESVSHRADSNRKSRELRIHTPRILEATISAASDGRYSVIQLVSSFQSRIAFYVVAILVVCLLFHLHPLLFVYYSQYSKSDGQYGFMDYWYANNSVSNVFPHLLVLFLLLLQCTDRRVSMYTLFQRGERTISPLSFFSASLLCSALDQYIYDLSGGVISGKHCEYLLYAMSLLTLKASLSFDIDNIVRKFISDE